MTLCSLRGPHRGKVRVLMFIRVSTDACLQVCASLLCD
jgi:hypothetical protein